MYVKVLVNRIREGTEERISNKQGGFTRGKGCVDYISAVRQVCEKYLQKGKDVYWALKDLDKGYD